MGGIAAGTGATDCGSGGGACGAAERLARVGGGASGIGGGAALARGPVMPPPIVGTAARAGGLADRPAAGRGAEGTPTDASALAAAAAAFSAISSRVNAVVGVGIDANGRTAGPLPVSLALAGGAFGDDAGGMSRWLTA